MLLSLIDGGIKVAHIKAKKDIRTAVLREVQERTVRRMDLWMAYTARAWCNSMLKVAALNKCHDKGAISYRGIAADEPVRLARLDGVWQYRPLRRQVGQRQCAGNGARKRLVVSDLRG